MAGDFLAAAAFSALIFFSMEATVALMVDKFFLAVEAFFLSVLHADVFCSVEVLQDLPFFWASVHAAAAEVLAVVSFFSCALAHAS